MLKVLEKVVIGLEKLQVAEEELKVQNEELAIAPNAIEIERKCYQDLFEFALNSHLVTNDAGIIHEANLDFP